MKWLAVMKFNGMCDEVRSVVSNEFIYTLITFARIFMNELVTMWCEFVENILVSLNFEVNSQINNFN